MAKKKTNKDTNKISLIIALILLLILIFCVGKIGLFGIILNNLNSYLFGPYYLLTLLSIIFYLFYRFIPNKKLNISNWFFVGLIVLNIAFYLYGAYKLYPYEEYSFSNIKEISYELNNITSINDNYGGGLIGMLLLLLSYFLFSVDGSELLILFLFIIAVILIVPVGAFISVLDYLKKIKIKPIKKTVIQNKPKEKIKKKPIIKKEKDNILIEEQIKPKEIIPEKIIEEEKIVSKTTYASDSNYILPSLDLLDKSKNKTSESNKYSADIKGKRLIQVLENFGVNAELINTYIGPSVTKFEVKPDYSINLSKVTSLQNNLKMELAAKSIRIEAPVPGKSVVGVEIPNAESSMVKLYDLMRSVPLKHANNKLLFALGKDVTGNPVFCELNKMPHLLIAGATGSGKSVCINTILCSLLLRTRPEEVRLVLIDPKMVEFSPYHDLPHLLWPVVTDSLKAANILNRLNVIMDERYNLFMEASVKNIETYNSFVNEYNKSLKKDEKPKEKLPYIIVVIDELAELMSLAKNDVQTAIQRFTAKARASGMHLIVATQRPSVDVITGLIKSNIPSRISFAVASATDSRTILDSKGAEDLLGNGDMLYVPQGQDPRRIQGAYVSEKEIDAITNEVKKQAKPDYDDYYYQLENLNNEDNAFAFSGEGGNTKDPLYDDCIEFIKKSRKASGSILQRQFGIGYNRAARIIDQLEKNGLIGPSNGSKSREIYIKDNDE